MFESRRERLGWFQARIVHSETIQPDTRATACGFRHRRYFTAHLVLFPVLRTVPFVNGRGRFQAGGLEAPTPADQHYGFVPRVLRFADLAWGRSGGAVWRSSPAGFGAARCEAASGAASRASVSGEPFTNTRSAAIYCRSTVARTWSEAAAEASCGAVVLPSFSARRACCWAMRTVDQSAASSSSAWSSSSSSPERVGGHGRPQCVSGVLEHVDASVLLHGKQARRYARGSRTAPPQLPHKSRPPSGIR